MRFCRVSYDFAGLYGILLIHINELVFQSKDCIVGQLYH